jgi:ABC-2 type transport system permease protein
MGNSERIAKERESGWVRQLRLTPLPGHGYVLAKTASAAVVSLPSIVVVFVVAAAVKPTGDAVRPITMIVYFGLSLLGGLWMPATTFPRWLQNIADWLPTHAYAALGQAIERSQAPHLKDVTLLVVFFALFAGGAAWLYRKDTLKA